MRIKCVLRWQNGFVTSFHKSSYTLIESLLSEIHVAIFDSLPRIRLYLVSAANDKQFLNSYSLPKRWVKMDLLHWKWIIAKEWSLIYLGNRTIDAIARTFDVPSDLHRGIRNDQVIASGFVSCIQYADPIFELSINTRT